MSHLAKGVVGDLINNLSILKSLLGKIKYDRGIDEAAIRGGSTNEFIAILHYALLRMSPAVARWLTTQAAAASGTGGSDSTPLYGKNDVAFTEAVYKLVRNVFQIVPALSASQFLAPGFAERKMHFVCSIIKMCMAKHNEFRKQFGVKPKPKVRSSGATKAITTASEVAGKTPRDCCVDDSILRNKNTQPATAAVAGGENHTVNREAVFAAGTPFGFPKPPSPAASARKQSKSPARNGSTTRPKRPATAGETRAPALASAAATAATGSSKSVHWSDGKHEKQPAAATATANTGTVLATALESAAAAAVTTQTGPSATAGVVIPPHVRGAVGDDYHGTRREYTIGTAATLNARAAADARDATHAQELARAHSPNRNAAAASATGSPNRRPSPLRRKSGPAGGASPAQQTPSPPRRPPASAASASAVPVSIHERLAHLSQLTHSLQLKLDGHSAAAAAAAPRLPTHPPIPGRAAPVVTGNSTGAASSNAVTASQRSAAEMDAAVAAATAVADREFRQTLTHRTAFAEAQSAAAAAAAPIDAENDGDGDEDSAAPAPVAAAVAGAGSFATPKELVSVLMSRFDRFESDIRRKLDTLQAKVVLMDGKLRFYELRSHERAEHNQHKTQTAPATSTAPSTAAATAPLPPLPTQSAAAAKRAAATVAATAPALGDTKSEVSATAVTVPVPVPAPASSVESAAAPPTRYRSSVGLELSAASVADDQLFVDLIRKRMAQTHQLIDRLEEHHTTHTLPSAARSTLALGLTPAAAPTATSSSGSTSAALPASNSSAADVFRHSTSTTTVQRTVATTTSVVSSATTSAVATAAGPGPSAQWERIA